MSAADGKNVGILFDLDGVLIDSPRIHAQSWVEVFKPYGINLPHERLHRDEGRKAVEIAENISNEYNLDIGEEDISGLIARKRDYYRRNAQRGFHVGVRAVIEILKSSGWLLGIVSGSVRENMNTALYEHELELFDVKITAEDYSHGKPDPEPFLMGCKALNLCIGESFAVENAPLGIESAKAAGLNVIALTSTLPSSELKNADEIIDRIDRLPEVIDHYKKVASGS